MVFLDGGRPFFKGNLHLHTQNSDGALSLEDAEKRYQELGYDFIAVTDHWKRTADTHYYKNMLVIPGIEVDFFLVNQVIHIVGIGVDEGMGHLDRTKFGPQSAVNRIIRGGGQAILAHPAWSLNTPDTIAGLQNIAAAEIYNAVSSPPFNGDRADSMALLDAVAVNRRLINTVASDDTHYYQGDEGQAFIRIQAEELTQASVMEAFAQGSFHASCGPSISSLSMEGDSIHITCSPARHIVFLSNLPWASRRNFTGEGITQASYTIKRHIDFPETFVRAVVIDAQGRKAWANPIKV